MYIVVIYITIIYNYSSIIYYSDTYKNKIAFYNMCKVTAIENPFSSGL